MYSPNLVSIVFKTKIYDFVKWLTLRCVITYKLQTINAYVHVVRNSLHAPITCKNIDFLFNYRFFSIHLAKVHSSGRLHRLHQFQFQFLTFFSFLSLMLMLMSSTSSLCICIFVHLLRACTCNIMWAKCKCIMIYYIIHMQLSVSLIIDHWTIERAINKQQMANWCW